VTGEEGKRKMMATQGARLLEDQSSVPETLGAVSMRHAGDHATLRTVTQTTEQGLTQCLQIHVWWLGTEDKPEATKAMVELNKEYFAIKMSAQDLQALVGALQADTVSYKTFYAQLQSGGLARPGVTAEQEQTEIESEQETPELEPPIPGQPVPPGQPGGPPALPGAQPPAPGQPPAQPPPPEGT